MEYWLAEFNLLTITQIDFNRLRYPDHEDRGSFNRVISVISIPLSLFWFRLVSLSQWDLK